MLYHLGSNRSTGCRALEERRYSVSLSDGTTGGSTVGSLDGSDNGSEFGVLGLGSGSTAVLSFPFGDSTGGRSGTFELRAVDV